jgi:hypothetical protein
MPGSKISWDEHIHAVGEEIRTSVQMAIWLCWTTGQVKVSVK